MKNNLFQPKTRNFNMSLPYARATVSTHDVAVLRTYVSCLYLKNDVAHDLSVSKNIQ